MTEPQCRALDQLRRSYPFWRDAYGLQVSRATLDALVRRGLVERRQLIGALFNPRIDVKYRVIPQAAIEAAEEGE